MLDDCLVAAKKSLTHTREFLCNNRARVARLMPMHLHQLPPLQLPAPLVNVLYCMMACKRRLKFIQGSGKKGTRWGTYYLLPYPPFGWGNSFVWLRNRKDTYACSHAIYWRLTRDFDTQVVKNKSLLWQSVGLVITINQ